MSMTATSTPAQEITQERAPLISVDKLQSVQKNVKNTEAKENSQ